MAITTRTSGTVTIVELRGKMTADRGVAQFAETIRGLLDNGQTRIVVNCEDVPYLDSAGSGELVKAYIAVSRRGGAIKLMHLRTGFWGGLLTITRLLTIFDTFDDEAKAIASFGGDEA